MLIQYVQQTMSKTPQQEQAGDQYKRDKIRLPSGSGKQSFLIILFHACYLLRVGKDTLFFQIIPSSHIRDRISRIRRTAVDRNLAEHIQSRIQIQPENIRI